MDSEWGHLRSRCRAILPSPLKSCTGGHEYVACQARKAGIGLVKEGNCFTQITDRAAFAAIADTLSQQETIR
jgi:hypothetical protein